MKNIFYSGLPFILFSVLVSCNNKPITGIENGYEWVDLGLSVKWATFNVGAEKPEQYGDYYAWGEIEPKSDYSYSTYKFRVNGSKGGNFIKYINPDRDTELDMEDDVAHVMWGGTWRMPSLLEWNELVDKCILEETTLQGIKGYKITSTVDGYTSCYIFLPSGGLRIDKELRHLGEFQHPCYWSRDLFGYTNLEAYAFHGSSIDVAFGHNRSDGCLIRPVCP